VALFVVVSAATGGTVLRVTARVFFGLGPVPGDPGERDQTKGVEEQEANLSGQPPTMVLAIAVLLLSSLALGALPGAHRAAEHAAAYFVQGSGYARAALSRLPGNLSVAAVGNWDVTGLALGFLSALLAVGVAAGGLYTKAIVAKAGALGEVGKKVIGGLRSLHSGHIGDYVTWLMVGDAALFLLVGTPVALSR
jgi:multicomponent Na+:H+ antiporter subunit D